MDPEEDVSTLSGMTSAEAAAASHRCTSAFLALAHYLDSKILPRSAAEITIPRYLFFAIAEATGFVGRGRRMQWHGMGINIATSGDDAFGVALCGVEIESHREALTSEMLSRLKRGCIAELPEGTGGNRVSPRAEPIGKIPVTPSPAGGDDRNPNSLAHLSDEAKVVAAKEAVAAYARNKQLPSAAHLALFGELDGKRAGNKGSDEPPTSGRLRSAFSVGKWGGIRWVATDFAAPGADKTVAAIRRADGSIVATNLPAGTVVATAIGDKFASFTVLRDATGETEIFSARIVDDIKRNDHSLSAEPLSRAIDQIWVRENGRPYADLIGSRAERLAEMVCRGDSAADGERG